MDRSYEKINYRVRPAKAIERKMLCDLFRRLSIARKTEEYQYIGFGSTYFSDFILFHKSLGICDMVSIEKDKENSERFEFNRPFNCIELKFGTSTELLPTLNWKKPSIVWLDYDGMLDNQILADVRTCISNIQEFSVLIFSINAHPESISNQTDDSDAYRINKLKERISHEKIPPDVSERHLREWGLADVSRRIIHNEILSTLSDINGGKETPEKIEYKQLFNFHYQDGAKMLTVGGVIYPATELKTSESCAFEELLFVRTNSDAFEICVPNLTLREMRLLEEKLPTSDSSKIEVANVPAIDIKNYATVYRYFPTFAETEL